MPIFVKASRRAKAHTRRSNSSLKVIRENQGLANRIYHRGVDNVRSPKKVAVYNAMKTASKKRLIADIIFSRSNHMYSQSAQGLYGKLNKKIRSSRYFGNK